jgi:hypothetical protein
MDIQETAGFIGLLAAECLRDLVNDECVSSDQIQQSQWYLRPDDGNNLNAKMFFAAASVDQNGRPYLLINPTSPLKALAWAIPHEAIHIAQICKGDLEPGHGYSTWRGTRFNQLTADDPSYVLGQPWEAEAQELEARLREQMYVRHPILR